MEQKAIKDLIEKSGVLGFDFENDDVCVTWEVTPGAGMMLARRVADYDDGDYEEECFAVPYAELNSVDALYDDILIDFVEFYFDSLRGGDGDEWNLFSDIASPADEGLREMLSFFGKTYGEFLCRVFFWYGIFIETDELVDEDDCDESELNEDERLVKKVLDRLGERTLDIYYDEMGAGYYWVFTLEHDEIWYSSECYGCSDYGYYIGDPEYGHISIYDADAVFSLSDFIRAQLSLGDYRLEDSGNCLGLLGIELDEI